MQYCQTIHPSGAATAQGRSVRVLIIDDSEDSAFIMSQLLSRAGLDVRIAVNGEEALQLAADFQPDVALLDICLPNMDGYEVARRLRDVSSHARIRIIALSGVNVDFERDRLAEIDLHLLKPAGLNDVLRAMHVEQLRQLPVAKQ